MPSASRTIWLDLPLGWICPLARRDTNNSASSLPDDFLELRQTSEVDTSHARPMLKRRL